MNKFLKYCLNLAISIDQLGNTFTGGDPDETISSRLGKIQRIYHGTIPWYRPFSKFLVWGLDKVDKNHCEDAIEPDEGKDAVCKNGRKENARRNS